MTNLCVTPAVLGCTDINAINYNPKLQLLMMILATTSQIDGCTGCILLIITIQMLQTDDDS